MTPYWQTLFQRVLDEQGHIIINSPRMYKPGDAIDSPIAVPEDETHGRNADERFTAHVLRVATEEEFRAQLKRYNAKLGFLFPYFYAVIAE